MRQSHSEGLPEVTKNLFGETDINRQSFEVNIFHDEREMRGAWFYHGYLIATTGSVPTLTARLNDLRIATGCVRPVHFADLTAHSTTSSRTRLAVAWAKACWKELHAHTYFCLFGLDLTKVDYEFFAGNDSARSEEDARIYNKFMEIGLYGALRFFFPWEANVNVVNVFSHQRSREETDSFRWRPIYNINRRDRNITLTHSQIIEISDDPIQEATYPQYSELIQYVDVVMGAISHNLDYFAKSKTGCDEVSDILLPLTEWLVGPRPDYRSPFYKRYCVSFFPKVSASPDNLSHTVANQFYHQREIRRIEKRQLRLI